MRALRFGVTFVALAIVSIGSWQLCITYVRDDGLGRTYDKTTFWHQIHWYHSVIRVGSGRRHWSISSSMARLTLSDDDRSGDVVHTVGVCNCVLHTRDASLRFGGQRFEIKLTAPFHYLTCKWKWYYTKFRTCTITMVYFYYYFNLIYCARLS